MTRPLIDRSLCQLRGISRVEERRYHEAEIADVDALLRYLALHGSMSLLKRVEPQVIRFRKAQVLGMMDVMVNMFPVGTRARVVSDRLEKTLFFDIETDGVAPPRAHVTLIASSMNGVERVFVRGVDLLEFLELWNKAEVIVSFNGKHFDVPILMREFGLSRIPAHVDLLDEARHYGLKGGLKAIEGRIGFRREENDCCNGLEAVEFWRRCRDEGNVESLTALMRYNLDDVRSLVALYTYILPLATEGLSDY